MRKSIEIIVDVLSNSIVNTITGDVFDTEILRIGTSDYPQLKHGWNFDWIGETKHAEVYKLTVANNYSIIQGLISLNDNENHIAISLIENARFNIGKHKVYEGVAGNLFAFACKSSFDRGYKGYVAFYAKSNLIEHYQKTLGAKRVGNSQLMILDNTVAQSLLQQYFSK
ncbi:MAG: hypothetical protein KGZ58_11950 [Ignavibacteriales bacterium]|nr:hypothetical protein [Ignavibacteriales bacterium]